MAMDFLGICPAIPSTHNEYTYVWNNPVLFIDYFGLTPELPELFVGATVTVTNSINQIGTINKVYYSGNAVYVNFFEAILAYNIPSREKFLGYYGGYIVSRYWDKHASIHISIEDTSGTIKYWMESYNPYNKEWVPSNTCFVSNVFYFPETEYLVSLSYFRSLMCMLDWGDNSKPPVVNLPAYLSSTPNHSQGLEQLKSSPKALRWTGNAVTTYAGESDVSVIARMVFIEDHKSIAAHFWVLENRRQANLRGENYYSGTTYRSLTLGVNQFAMSNIKALDPESYFSNGGQENWKKCVDEAYKLVNNGISSFPKPDGITTQTRTHSAIRGKFNPDNHSKSKRVGDTWFYNQK